MNSMEPIPENLVEQTWQEVAAYTPDHASGEMKRIGEDQPELLAFMVEFTQDLEPQAIDLGIYLFFVVYRIFEKWHAGKIGQVSPDEIIACYEANADLMESLFDFSAIRAMIAGGFSIAFDAMSAVTGPYATEILERRLGAPTGTVMNGTPLPDFGHHHPDPNLVHAKALYDRMMMGEFQPLGEDDIVRELRLFLEHLDGVESRIASDHVLNLLEELEGKLPEDKDRLIGLIDRYLSMPDEDRMIFRLGRRQGLYRRLDDLQDRQTYLRLKKIVEGEIRNEPERLERYLYQISQCFLP